VIRRVAKIVAALLAAWIVIIVVLGWVLGGSTAERVTARLGESLQATATHRDASLALVRGRLEFRGLALRRDDAIGKLTLDVADVRCELSPLGLALLGGDCSELAVSGVRMEVSTAALFRVQRPKRQPIHAERVIVEDATLAFAPSAFVPDLGGITIKIERAEAGPTTFKTPLSFLFNLRELRARLDLPAGITMRLHYRGGVLSATGSLFGSTPVELPVTLPVADAAEDAQSEVKRLVRFGKDLAERLLARSAEDWLGRKLSLP
jgi:hypothetical protein